MEMQRPNGVSWMEKKIAVVIWDANRKKKWIHINFPPACLPRKVPSTWIGTENWTKKESIVQGNAAKTTSENILHRLQRDRWNSTAAAAAASVSCVFFFRQLLGLGPRPGLLRKNPAAHKCGWDMSFGVTISNGKMHTIYIILLQSLNCLWKYLPDYPRLYRTTGGGWMVSRTRQGNKTVSMWRMA